MNSPISSTRNKYHLLDHKINAGIHVLMFAVILILSVIIWGKLPNTPTDVLLELRAFKGNTTRQLDKFGEGIKNIQSELDRREVRLDHIEEQLKSRMKDRLYAQQVMIWITRVNTEWRQKVNLKYPDLDLPEFPPLPEFLSIE